MKIFLGALAAAALLGVGCAHNREVSPQAERPRSPQASVEGSPQMPGYACEVVDSSASGTAQSQPPMKSEAQAAVVQIEVQEDTAIGGPAPEEGAVLGEAQEDKAIGGPALEDDAFEDTGMGGGGGGGG